MQSIMCYGGVFRVLLYYLHGGAFFPFRVQVMEKLLKDNNTMVLGSAVAAFTEVRAPIWYMVMMS